VKIDGLCEMMNYVMLTCKLLPANDEMIYDDGIYVNELLIK
jgi:hypothetical protein